MLKASAPPAPIVHKRSALDIPLTDAQVLPTEVKIRPKRKASSKKPLNTSSSLLENETKLGENYRELTRFETAVMEVEAKSLIELSNELFPDDPLALELPMEVYKTSLPARLIYEAPSQPLPALPYPSGPIRPSRAAKSQRTPRQDLPNILDFDPTTLHPVNAQAVGGARSSVLVHTADTLPGPRRIRPTPLPSDRKQPTPFELALGLKS